MINSEKEFDVKKLVVDTRTVTLYIKSISKSKLRLYGNVQIHVS